MAAITIRNLSDEVVDGLKQRARKNSRSMEAEVRAMLLEVLEPAPSGIETQLAHRLARLSRWSIPTAELEARLAADPLTAEQRERLNAWADEIDAHRDDPLFAEDFRDPWEHDAASP